MAFVNYNNKEITIKIVYYGPAFSGKNTCFQYIYSSKAFRRKGKLITLDTDGEGTLFFDFSSSEIGKLGDYSIKMQLYTTPGQVEYNTTRKLVLQGTDGVVFVADSQVVMREQNIDSFKNLKENLKANKISYNELPLIFLYNKRDLKNILPVEVLNKDLNHDKKPFFPTIDTTGENILEALNTIMKMVIIYLKSKLTVFQKDKTVMFSREEATDTISMKNNIKKELEDAEAFNKYDEEEEIFELGDNKYDEEEQIFKLEDYYLPDEVKLGDVVEAEKLNSEENELKARDYTSKCQYPEGRECLFKAITYDPARKKRLNEEFGFLYDLNETSEKDKINWGRRKEQIEWRRQIWQIISSRNSFELMSISDTLIAESNQIQKKETIDTYDGEVKTSEMIGEELEQAMMKLFREFLSMCDDDNAFTLTKARQQKRGSQFGYDLQFMCEIKGNKELKLLIECKNYKKEIRLKDIADKLQAAKANYNAITIDHWILISPRADVSNELNNLLDLWEKIGEYPFKVQVWSPETRVSEFFGLLPEIYDIFFKPANGETHPKDWGEAKKLEVVEIWKRKLEPPLRLPTGWEQYLRSPGKFMLQGDTPDLENLYQHHVTMNCIDETGALTHGKTLEDKVMEWLEKPLLQHPTIILHFPTSFPGSLPRTSWNPPPPVGCRFDSL